MWPVSYLPNYPFTQMKPIVNISDNWEKGIETLSQHPYADNFPLYFLYWFTFLKSQLYLVLSKTDFIFSLRILLVCSLSRGTAGESVVCCDEVFRPQSVRRGVLGANIWAAPPRLLWYLGRGSPVRVGPPLLCNTLIPCPQSHLMASPHFMVCV